MLYLENTDHTKVSPKFTAKYQTSDLIG